MDVQLEEYLRRRQLLAEDALDGADPADMDRSLSPEPLALRERPRFDSLMDGLAGPRLAAEEDAARGYATADEVSDMAGRMLGRDGIPAAPGALGTRKPVVGTGLPSSEGGGSGLGYLDALRKAQQQDDVSAAVGRLGSAGEQFAEVVSRGAYRANPLKAAPTEVEKLAQRRALVAEYLKQQRDAEESASNSAYKLALAKRMAQEKPTPPPKPGLTQEQIDAQAEATLDKTKAAADKLRQPHAVKAPKPPDTGPKLNKAAETLRKEFNGLPVVKQYNEVEAAYTKVKGAAGMPSGAGDLSLIYAYMRLLDPGSAVKEGEFANAQNAGGVDDKIRSMANRVRAGERLSEDQRRDFVAHSRELYATHARQLNDAAERYTSIAKKSGADPEDVVIRPPSEERTQAPKPGPAPAGMVHVRRKSDGVVVPVDASLADKLIAAQAAELVR